MTDRKEEARIINELTRSDNGTDPFSSAVRATRMPMLITDPRQDDNPIVFANQAFARLTGFDRDEVLGRNCRFLQGPETDRADVARLRQAIIDRMAIELELLNYRKDGSTFWNRLLVSPVFGDDGELTYFFASQFDVTTERERLANLQRDRDDLEAQVERRNAELLASEQRLGFALKAGRLGSWSFDPMTERMVVSDRCKQNFGRPISQPFTYADLKQAVHPDDRERRDAALAAAIGNGDDYDIEYRILTPAGEERWLQVRGQAHARADGTPLIVVGTSQDVTARRQAEDHRALLANELSHRVKNTLATLQSIVAQTIRNANSLEAAGETLSARIMSMAAANDLLINERWESAPITDLFRRALAPFGVDDADRFYLSGPDVRLQPRVAIAFALALHELATNASKYGALSLADGSVTIDWQVVTDTRPASLQVIWTEEGGPAVTPPDRLGFGSRLIERVLALEIGGTAKLDYRPEGVVFTAEAPLPDVLEEATASAATNRDR
ncbi:histidine kinase [Croceibacterium mercuriale]|uniref:histidine kinase n=1 Tax=Croceibacterium mercuriale TaxID=1572751 RepID=A0A0B2C3J8_9SPHN|nr:PAS domain-containing protein [Croceibacterium mercuriale]KHL26606.1 histidine kinase [Croceibacterium mercuriale]